MQGRLLGEPVTGPHPAIQRGLIGTVELEEAQPVGIDDGQPGQRVGVDAVRLGVAREVPPHVVRLGRGDPEDLVAREMKNTAMGSQAGPVGSITTSSTVSGGAPSKAAASRALRLSVVGTALRLATTLPSPLSTRAVCALAMPRSRPMIRRSSMSNLLSRCLLRQTQVVGTISPRSQGGRLAAAPTHVLQPAPASRTEPLPSSGSSVARPSGGSQSYEAKGLSLPSEPFSSPPPRPAGMLYATSGPPFSSGGDCRERRSPRPCAKVAASATSTDGPKRSKLSCGPSSSGRRR